MKEWVYPTMIYYTVFFIDIFPLIDFLRVKLKIHILRF